jgi:exosortase
LNTATSEFSRTGGRVHGLFQLVAGGLLAWSYLPTFAFYAREHWNASNHQGAYAHAPLVLVAICWLVWRRRAALCSEVSVGLSLKGLLLLGAGAAARVYGDTQGYVVLQGMTVVPLLAGALLVLYGEEAWRAMRAPVLLLLLVIPLPNAALDALTRPLIDATASMAVPLLGLFDIEVARTGQLLTANARGSRELHEIIVAPECSGIRSLVALLAISGLIASLRDRSPGQTFLLLLLTPLIAMLANVTRVVVIIVLIVHVSPASAENVFHSLSGVVLFVLAAAGIVWFDSLIDRSPRAGAR